MKQKKLLETQRFDVVQQVFRNDLTATDATFVYLKKRDGVSIVPIFRNKFVMLFTFRPLTGKKKLEFPGGQIEEGETPLQAANRELVEETGGRTKKLAKIGEIQPYPHISDEKLHIFEAQLSNLPGPAASRNQRLEGIHEIRLLSAVETESYLIKDHFHFSADVHAIMLYRALNSERRKTIKKMASL